MYRNAYKNRILWTILTPMKKAAALTLLCFLLLSRLSAETADNQWKEIKTKHFVIIFQKRSKKSALDVAGFCEEVYTKVTDFFGSYPDNIHCVIHDDIDTANGSFTIDPLQINLYVTSPSTPLIGAHTKDWMKLLLTHELTHYVNLTYHKGIFYHLSRIFGKTVSTVPTASLPGWAIEGIAVKLETDMTEGGRGRNPFFEMKYRAEVLDNTFYTWKKAAYSSYYPPADRIYQAGYLLNDYLAKTYGNDIFVRIYKKYLIFPLFRFRWAFRKVTGKSIKEVFADMKKDLYKKYRNTSLSAGTRISPNIFADYFLPVMTPEGWILYRRSLDKEPAIVVFNPKTKKETILVKTTLTDYSSLSAEKKGTSIVFSSCEEKNRNRAAYTLTSDLYFLSVKTKKTTRLTRNGHLWQPALSPDGKRIIAVQKNGQYTHLVEVDKQTGEIKTLFRKRGTTVYNPSFSPNGEAILFTLNSSGKQDIWILDRTGKGRNLTANMAGEKYFPRFIGNHSIIFSCDQKGLLSLYSMNINKPGKNSGIKQICTDPVGAYAGTIAGNKIIYASYSSKGYCLKEKPLDSETLSVTSLPLSHKIEEKVQKERNTLSFSSSTYTDSPELLFWIPTIVSLDPINPSPLSFAPGFISSFRSPLQKISIDTRFSLLSSPSQPEGSLQFIYNGELIQTGYSLYEGYTRKEETGTASQTTMQYLSFSVPFISHTLLGSLFHVTGNTGLMNDNTISADEDFYFNERTATNTTTSNTLYWYGGFNTEFTREGSPKDIIPPSGLAAAQTFYIPLTGNTSHTDWFGHLSLSLPSPFIHQVLRIESKWGYEYNDELDLLPDPRGFNTGSEKQGKIISGMDYLFTLGLLDIPLVNKISLQGITGGVHLEKEFDFNLGDTSFETNSQIYTGAELSFLVSFMGMLNLAGIGINARIDTNNLSSFRLDRDIGIYIFLGTNSFNQSVQSQEFRDTPRRY